MKKILAVGLSATIQETITFDRLALDAVNRSTGYRLDASGKSVNAARVLNQLESGCAISLCPLGRDNAGDFLALASRDGMEVDWVPVPGRVRYCYTLLEPGTGRATELVVSEPVAPIGQVGSTGPDPASVGVSPLGGAGDEFARALEALLSRLSARLPDASAVLIAGSRPLSFPQDAYARIRELAAASLVPVMADFRGSDLSAVLARRPPEILKINEEEFCETFALRYPLSEENLARELEAASARLGIALVVTRGERDTFAALRGTGFRQRVEPVVALNAIGSGDAFSAGFLHEWLASGDMARALEAGTRCGAKNALSIRPGSILDLG